MVAEQVFFDEPIKTKIVNLRWYLMFNSETIERSAHVTLH